MTGKQLFSDLTERDFSGSAADEYAQLLQTIAGDIGDDIYPLLERAESQGKKLAVKDLLADEIILENVILK